MCPWREIAQHLENHGLMSPAIWESIRPHLPEIQSVDFTGGGEPLLQPNLAEWIGQAHAAGCETGFLSNGLLLKKEKLQRILNAGVDWICISMDGADAQMYEKIRIGSDFERVCGHRAWGIEQSELRPKYLSSVPTSDICLLVTGYGVRVIRIRPSTSSDEANGECGMWNLTRLYV